MIPKHFISTCIAAVALLPVSELVAQDSETALPEEVGYNQHIRPILSQNCFSCHGSDPESRKAKLRLDLRDSALAMRKEGASIVPNHPEKSLLVDRIYTDDPDDVMPPLDSNHTLTDREKSMLRKWITQGAEYQEHWSFMSLHQPPLPVLKKNSWSQHPVDLFVLAKLQQEGKRPAKSADKAALFRRLTLDLTGLPPERDALAAFLSDKSEGAYVKAVDALMLTQAYAEHRARYWLDTVRYADTHGLHLDNYREMWSYRDYVLDAFRVNMPFDRFVTEQLAGDLLDEPTQDQLIASGYNRLHLSTSEGGVIKEEVYVSNVKDQVNAFGTIFLGLTTGCAACHDHKFDPVSQKEYYQLFAFFNSLKTAVLDNNKKDPPPVIKIYSEDQKERWETLTSEVADLTKQKVGHMARVTDAAAAWATVQRTEMARLYPLDVDKPSVPGEVLALDFNYHHLDRIMPHLKSELEGNLEYERNDGSLGAKFTAGQRLVVKNPDVRFVESKPFSIFLRFLMRRNNSDVSLFSQKDLTGTFAGLDIGLKNSTSVVIRFGQDKHKQAIIVAATDILARKKWANVVVSYDGSGKASGFRLFKDGEEVDLYVELDALEGPVRSDADVAIGGTPTERHFTGLIDTLSVYGRQLSSDEMTLLSTGGKTTSSFGLISSLTSVTGKSDEAWKPVAAELIVSPELAGSELSELVIEHYLVNNDDAGKEVVDSLTAAEKSVKDLLKKLPTTLVSEEMEAPKPSYVLRRGAYDSPGDKVERETPIFLPPFKEGWSNDRLGLAKWVTDPTHPLLARVTVNRFWQQIFGVGLTKTAEDVGSQGEFPSHPELLDYLASGFIESGWDVNAFFKLLVTSETYKQRSQSRPIEYLNDPENRLLSRGSRYRLDAEVIRDQNLFAAGLLNVAYGGPSVKPPQPEGLWSAVGYTDSNTARFKVSTGDDVYRRSVYTFRKRTSPPPQMNILDAPSRETCSVRRERTNTPMAALMLMNEEQSIEVCVKLAQAMVGMEDDSDTERLRRVFGMLLSRDLTRKEKKLLLRALSDFRDGYREKPTEAAKLFPEPEETDVVEKAAWVLLINSLMNLDERITRQ